MANQIMGMTRKCFYPRHPRGWRPGYCIHLGDDGKVSIHATLAGGDFKSSSRDALGKGFYPRHPRGWRRVKGAHFDGTYAFLSTPPSRVATGLAGTYNLDDLKFLSTPPSRVATAICDRATFNYFLFLSTPPSRVATWVFVLHRSLSQCFYPRHPRGWRLRATRSLNPLGLRFYPRHPRGWRLYDAAGLITGYEFLSTPPSRVATRSHRQ